MRTQILNHLGDPPALERMFRSNGSLFKKEFNLIYPQIMNSEAARVWNARLNFESDGILWGSKSEIVFVLIASLIAGILAKLPDITGINPEYFYPRNIAFVVFPFITAYFSFRQRLRIDKILVMAALFILSAVYMNIIPAESDSDTLLLAAIHIPVFLWGILCYAFSGAELRNLQGRVDYLRFNGDLLVMSAIIFISGILLAVITNGLFYLIDIRIEEFYFRHLGIFALAALPIVATHLVTSNSQLVSRISPVIANVFTPLVFITLVAYLAAIMYTGKDPYNDREFLLFFNALLLGVMALILFSTGELSKSPRRFQGMLLFALATAAIIINCIALSAIFFRISEWGFTPNRIAVSGANLLMLVNLLLVAYRLLAAVKKTGEIEKVGTTIAAFIPFYVGWAAIIAFVLPLVFSFR